MAENVKTDPKSPVPIKVRSLTFRGPTGITLPWGQVVTSIDGSPKKDPNRESYEIAFLPWMRMYRVSTVVNKAPRSFLVPEGWAIAEVED